MRQLARRNPYYVGDDIRIDLRDSSASFSSPSRAKYYYIYLNGQLVYKGTFETVGARVSRKEAIIEEAINEILYVESIEEKIVEPEEELEEEIEPEELEVNEKLAEDLYKELILHLEKEEPEFFQELINVPGRGKFTEEFKTVVSETQGGYIELLKIFYDLDEPFVIGTEKVEEFIDLFERNYVPKIREAFEDYMIGGKNLYIFTFLYKYKVSSRKMATKGISTKRVKATSWVNLRKGTIDKFYDLLRSSDKQGQKYKRYLSIGEDNKIYSIGFSLENYYNLEKLPAKKLKTLAKEQKKKYKKKRKKGKK